MSNTEPSAPPPKPMPPTVDEIPTGMDLVNYVAECLRMGCAPLDVRKQLVAFGLADANAEKMIADTTEWMRKNPYAGQPAPTGPLYWAVSHSGLVVGIISFLVGITVLSWPANADEHLHTGIGVAAIIFGIFAIIFDLFPRVVR